MEYEIKLTFLFDKWYVYAYKTLVDSGDNGHLHTVVYIVLCYISLQPYSCVSQHNIAFFCSHPANVEKGSVSVSWDQLLSE